MSAILMHATLLAALSSGYTDETLEAFQAAIDDGANFISMHVVRVHVVACHWQRSFESCDAPITDAAATAVQVATKDKVLVVRPSVTLDLNTNARNLRDFNKFKTAKVGVAAAMRNVGGSRTATAS